jgi:hypothetical protein
MMHSAYARAMSDPRDPGWRTLLANTTFTFGINNVFDAPPPFTADWYQGYDTQDANPIRRFFYVSVEKKFQLFTLELRCFESAGKMSRRFFLFSSGKPRIESGFERSCSNLPA